MKIYNENQINNINKITNYPKGDSKVKNLKINWSSLAFCGVTLTTMGYTLHRGEKLTLKEAIIEAAIVILTSIINLNKKEVDNFNKHL